MSILYSFTNIIPSSLWYKGVLSDNTQVEFNVILGTILNSLNDTTKIVIYINNEKMIEFSYTNVYYVNEKVQYRTWLCNSIYQKLTRYPNSQYVITFDNDRLLSIIVYEMLKYASMMQQTMRIETEQI